ncbi:MAG: hypothetical protein EHM36_14390 [Deltaproteobacteria bacterium]|nr:MAG: hypothetical protein EHM36_14390 [Deltaproteobacteria bacterium]
MSGHAEDTLIVEFKQPATQRVIFHNSAGEVVGTLYLEDPMRFEGNADESAKVFFESVIREIEQCGEKK